MYTDISHFRAPYKNWSYLGMGGPQATPVYSAKEETNWLLIGGIGAVAVGGIVLIVMATKKKPAMPVENRRSRRRR
jgi:hypothetical protein